MARSHSVFLEASDVVGVSDREAAIREALWHPSSGEAHKALDALLAALAAAREERDEMRRECQWRLTKYQEMLAELAAARETLRAIRANAEAWHVGVDGKAAALAVIAKWARDPATIPDVVREHARDALQKEDAA